MEVVWILTRKQVLLASLVVLLFLFPSGVSAADNKTGVGVLNVPPEFSMIRVVQQNSIIRVYLTVSDYNSWEDIYEVKVVLEYHGLETAMFTFRQYQDPNSYLKLYEFSETSVEKDLLVREKCSFSHSDKKETVEEKCNLDLLFVFHTTWFTRLNIVTYDRDGSTAKAYIDYNAEDLMRSNKMILIPWLYEPIPVHLSSSILNLIAVAAGVFGIVFFAKKKKMVRTADEI
jgi:hypothetical protein